MHHDQKSITIYNAQDLATKMRELYEWCKAMSLAGHRMAVEAKPEKRSDAQNRLLWSSLGDCARQITWHGQKLDAEAWKDMATAALKRQRVVPGIEGGFVVLGQRTSKMSKSEMADLITFIHAFGAQQGVIWSPTSIAMDMENT